VASPPEARNDESRRAPRGYEKAAEIAREAFGDNRSLVDLVVEKEYLTRAQVDEALRPENMLQPIRSSHESRE